jgi:uncharacterized protein YhdP
LFDPDWIPLKQLNASFEFNGKKVVVMLHEAKLNKIDLKAIKVQIKNINQRDPRIEVIGKINTQSEHFIEFLKRSTLDKTPATNLFFIQERRSLSSNCEGKY